MEIDLASINQELAKSMLKPNHVIPAGSEDSIIEKTGESAPLETPSVDNNLAKELSLLKEQHAEEIKRWKEYDRRIQEWKQQVQDVFQNMKKEISVKQEITAELIKCKSLLQSKDKELASLKAFIQQKEGRS